MTMTMACHVLICTLLITDIKEGVPWGVHQFLKFLVQLKYPGFSSPLIHIRNGILKKYELAFDDLSIIHQ